MTRRFSREVIEAAWRACEDAEGIKRCARCNGELWHGNVEFDHVKAHGLGGKSDETNIACLCRNCHREKTHREDRPIMQKADNQGYASLKQRKPWHPGFKHKIGGKVVPR